MEKFRTSKYVFSKKYKKFAESIFVSIGTP